MTRHDVPGSQLTTLAVGGPIDTVVDVASEVELITALSKYPQALCIGGGSNLLIADSGFSGVLIRSHTTASSGIHISNDNSLIRVEAPVDWDAFVQAAITHGLQGVEATSGIPGSFGGAIVQNLGAYGQEISDVVVTVNVWNTETRQTESLTKDECAFTYRNSRFKHDIKRRYVVTSAKLQLQQTDVSTPRYGDISQTLNKRFDTNGPYPLQAIRDAVLDTRRSKGMLLGTSLPSAGSFFTNPILTPSQTELLTKLGFKTTTRADGTTLVSAAALMQAAGFERGFHLGDAALSEFHVLAVVNAGNATATDIINLARHVRDEVYAQFGISLIPEPITLGFTENPFA